VVLTVGEFEKGEPVPKAVPPVATLYQLSVPLVHVPVKVTAVAEQLIGLFTNKLVGTVGTGFIVIAAVATLALLQVPFSQAAL
jgi:hypothetical protein